MIDYQSIPLFHGIVEYKRQDQYKYHKLLHTENNVSQSN